MSELRRKTNEMGEKDTTDIDAVSCNKHVCSCYKYLCIYNAVIVRNILIDTLKNKNNYCVFVKDENHRKMFYYLDYNNNCT